MFHDVTINAILLLDDGTPYDLDCELILGLVSLSHSLPFPHSAMFQGGEGGVLTSIGYISRASVTSWLMRALVVKGKNTWNYFSSSLCSQVAEAQTSAS